MKVLIIDDQPLFADGIRSLFKNYDSTISTSFAGDESLVYECFEQHNLPDLILLDTNVFGSEQSYELMDKLNIIRLQIPIIVISTNHSSEAIALAIENNVSGFIAKNCSRETVLKATKSVLSGKMFISKPPLVMPNKIEINQCERVTSRQQQVLYLLSQGLLNKQIAHELDISSNTVKAHLRDLFKSLHVTNRTAAVRNGQKNGLI